MAVYQKNGAWRIDVQMRGYPKVRRRTEATTERQAKELEAYVKLQLQAGIEPESLDLSVEGVREAPSKRRTKGTTMMDLYEKVYRMHWSGVRSAGTYYGPVGKTAIKRIGPDKYAESLTEDDVREFVRKCQEMGDSGRTLNARLAILGRLWALARKKFKVETAPINWSEFKVAQQKGRLRWVSREEERELLDKLAKAGRKHSENVSDLVKVLLDMGLRLGEALSLQVRDVHLSDNSITVCRGEKGPTKNHETRTLPMTKRARQVIEKRISEDAWGTSQRVFGDLAKHSIRTEWNRVKKEMGLQDDPGFILHALRHTCGTRLLEAGNDIRLVQQWLGHSDIETTTIYAKVTTKHLAQGADSLDRLEGVVQEDH